MSEGRSVWRMLFQNMRNSLKILPPKGKLVGEDNLGNKYFEVVEGYITSKKHPIRWFEPLKENDWQQNLPAEWEAWLRNRRKDAPTVEEVLKNAAIAQMKKERGDEIQKKMEKENPNFKQESDVMVKGFPKLDGLERDPGSTFDDKQKL